ncbi:MAG: Rrf2 family transcriptional regulator [candidate division Zixibacteria bacterium]|nr:Rrf2 family transcriptional regulator [candidate division Zixibacteria bacterium]
MFLSSTCQHALRALICLAKHHDTGPVLVREIARSANIPRPFLSKILHDLTRVRLVRSVKGPGGGFVLNRSPEQTTLAQVIEAIDGLDRAREDCILGLNECSDDAPCPLHEYWKVARARYLETIETVTLRDATRAAIQSGG